LNYISFIENFIGTLLQAAASAAEVRAASREEARL